MKTPKHFLMPAPSLHDHLFFLERNPHQGALCLELGTTQICFSPYTSTMLLKCPKGGPSSIGFPWLSWAAS